MFVVIPASQKIETEYRLRPGWTTIQAVWRDKIALTISTTEIQLSGRIFAYHIQNSSSITKMKKNSIDWCDNTYQTCFIKLCF